MGGLTDPRVTYWEPAKWIARLRATMRGGGPVLLRTNMGAGHGGASGRFNRLDEVAIVYAFALWAVGMARRRRCSLRSADPASAHPERRAPIVIARYLPIVVLAKARTHTALSIERWKSQYHGVQRNCRSSPKLRPVGMGPGLPGRRRRVAATAPSPSATLQNPSASARPSPDREPKMPRPFCTCSVTKSSNAVISNGLVGDLVGEMGGDHDDAVAVAEDHVAGKHRRVAAADRNVDLDRLVQGEVGRRARAMVEGREAEPRDLGRSRESRRR